MYSWLEADSVVRDIFNSSTNYQNLAEDDPVVSKIAVDD